MELLTSYKFGQFRATQNKDYLKNSEYTLNDKRVESSLSKGTFFIDKAIDLKPGSILQGRDGPQGTLKSYYLRVKIYKQEKNQAFNVELRNTGLLSDNSQTVGTIQVESGMPDDYSIFEFVITPNENRNFDQIHFELGRNLIDYELENPDGTFGRKVNLEVEKMAEINNLIDILNPSIGNTGALRQIGVQSAPGLMMCINGEQIRVGRSGLYEIKNGL